MDYKTEEMKKAKVFLEKNEKDEKIIEKKINLLRKYEDIWEEFIYFINTGEYINEETTEPVIVYGYSAYQLTQPPYFFSDECPFSALAFLRVEGYGNMFKHIKRLEAIERIAWGKERNDKRNPPNIAKAIEIYKKAKTSANLCAIYRMLSKTKLYIAAYDATNGVKYDSDDDMVKYINIYLDEDLAHKQHKDKDCFIDPVKFNKIHEYKDHEGRIMLNYEDNNELCKFLLDYDFVYEKTVPCNVYDHKLCGRIKFKIEFAEFHKDIPIEVFGGEPKYIMPYRI